VRLPATRPALAELGRGTRIVGVGKLRVGHPPNAHPCDETAWMGVAD
jgi:hypothetical protein